MRQLLVLAFALLLTIFGLAAEVFSQDFDPQEYLLGSWTVNVEKTQRRWSGDPKLKDLSHSLGQIPIAAPSIQFSKTELTFEIYEGFSRQSTFQVQSYDTRSKQLELKLTHATRESTIQLEVSDIDTLVLYQPASSIGAIEIVYTRKVRRNKDKPSELSKLSGKWHLDVEATKKLWEQSIEPDILESYNPIGTASLEEAQWLKIEANEIEFSDQSFGSWSNFKTEKETIFVGRRNDRSNGEINIISEQAIQFSQHRRNLFAVFKRDKDAKLSLESFPENNHARKFLKHFQKNKPRPPINNHLGPIAVSGNVEFGRIDITRRRSSFSAVGADMKSMSLEFLVMLPERNYAGTQNCMLKLTRLDDIQDIQDDSGKQLLEGRRERIKSLKPPVRINGSRTNRDGATGPTFGFTVNAPGVGATSLKNVSGQIEVIPFKTKKIRFKNIGALQGKPLEHPLLKGLDIQPRIKNGEFPKFVLSSSLETREKIVQWHLESADGEKLRATSHGRGNGEVYQGFRKPIPEDARLVMTVTILQSSRPFAFEFIDTKLP